jgi:hypothetical protein
MVVETLHGMIDDDDDDDDDYNGGSDEASVCWCKISLHRPLGSVGVGL